MNVSWSDVAAADLDDIFDYIARDVPYYAESFIDRLIAATDLLEDQPLIGRRVPEAGQRKDIREIIVQRYRIIYRVGIEDIDILTVIHGSRDLAGRDSKPWDGE